MSHPVWLESVVIVAVVVLIVVVRPLMKFWKDFDCMHSSVHAIEMKLEELGFMTAAMLDYLQVPMEEECNTEEIRAWDEAD